MMDWLIMFALLFALDYVYAHWTVACAEYRAGAASLWAMLCYLFTGIATVKYVSDPWLLVPAMAGCAAGTFVAVRMNRRKTNASV